MVGVHEHTQQDEGGYAAADAHHLLQQEAQLRGGLGFRGFCFQLVIMMVAVVVVRELLGQNLDEDHMDKDA